MVQHIEIKLSWIVVVFPIENIEFFFSNYNVRFKNAKPTLGSV